MVLLVFAIRRYPVNTGMECILDLERIYFREGWIDANFEIIHLMSGEIKVKARLTEKGWKERKELGYQGWNVTWVKEKEEY